MLQLKVDQLWKLSARRGISSADWHKMAKMAPRLLAALKKNYPDYLKMLDDRETVRLIQSYARRVEGKFEDLVVLGIGGSALGAVCLDTALRPLFSDRTMARRGRWPRLTVLDNIDPDLLADFEQTIDLSKTLFVVISKSGATPETQAQFLYFQKKMAARLADWHRNFVFVTDPGTGWLRHLAGHLAREKRPIVTFDIPPGVGGRFSVLSAVGLLPAAMTGIRIEQLLSGAKTARRQILQSRLSANPALSLAAVQYLLNRKGRSQQVFYVYAQKLRYLADWYRQLLAESIGKAVNRRGQKVQAGLTPVSALGVTDQHSQNQLYLEGPDDKIFLLVDVARPARRLSIPWRAAWSSLERPGALDYLRGVTFGRLLRAERLGTEQALVARQRPVISLTLDKLDARALGEVFVLLEASVSFLGELLNLDAYDQPGVELAKKLTRQILKNGR